MTSETAIEHFHSLIQRLKLLIPSSESPTPPPQHSADLAQFSEATHHLRQQLENLESEFQKLTLGTPSNTTISQFKYERLSAQLEQLARSIILEKGKTQTKKQSNTSKQRLYQPNLRHPAQELAKLKSFHSTLEQNLRTAIDHNATAHQIRALRARLDRCQDAIATVERHLQGKMK